MNLSFLLETDHSWQCFLPFPECFATESRPFSFSKMFATQSWPNDMHFNINNPSQLSCCSTSTSFFVESSLVCDCPLHYRKQAIDKSYLQISQFLWKVTIYKSFLQKNPEVIVERFIGFDRVPFLKEVIYSKLPMLDKIQLEEQDVINF